ncbi:hypothetical protein [Deinococcus planocerae]|nr:hypothetical protein [Deinococcus planocerae]
MVRTLFEATVQRLALRLGHLLPDLNDENLNTPTADDLGDEPARQVMSA